MTGGGLIGGGLISILTTRLGSFGGGLKEWKVI